MRARERQGCGTLEVVIVSTVRGKTVGGREDEVRGSPLGVYICPGGSLRGG
jgi:hypothetical protein